MLKWENRRFSFDLPPEMHPVVLERIRGTSARIQEMVQNKPHELLEYKPLGEWSIKEHIGHLTDLEELHEGRIDDFLEGVKTLRAADMENNKTNAANHNKKSIEELLSDFRFQRNIFIERLYSIEPNFWGQASLHPRLGKPMRVIDMVVFVAEHDDYHLALIREILRSAPGNLKKH
ncbi:MAG: DinB family protein [Bacteroidia bacterium]|nr:DinB family protein [Bacteroidia bacterium]